jgi:4-amino-4-deoxy-L-arabinose transferase-like glycosyltransferase
MARMAAGRARARVLMLLVAVSAVAGIVLRAAVLRSSLGVLDGDEAVWGLMARHALDGELTTFYWGQGYGGTLEVLLTAPLFYVFGTSVIAMRVVPIALTAATAVLVWRIGRRTIGEPAAAIAAALFWVWPPYVIWKSVRAHGFYGSGLVLAALLLLLVLRLAERRSRLDAALLGLVIGLAWWQTPQVVPIALPALVFLAVRRPRAYRDAWLAVPAALIAALPWIVSNVQHDWWSFRVDSGDTPYGGRLRGFFSATFPMAIGLRIPFTSEWPLGRPVSAVVYAALVIALAVVAWRKRRENVSLLVAVAAAYPFIYAISPSTWLVDEPRYVVLLIPVAVLLLAQPLTTVRRGALALAAAVAISSFVLLRLASSSEYEQRADGLFVPSDFKPLIAELDRRRINRVFSSYWIAYRLDFETRERLIAAESMLDTLYVDDGAIVPQVPKRPDDIRYAPYDSTVRNARNPAWVLLPGTPDETRNRPLLERAGYIRSLVGGFAVYERPPAPTLPTP